VKALVFLGTRQVEYGDYANAELSAGHVLIQVAACGICGTDMHVYQGMPATWPVPGVRGHEISGTVVETAPDVKFLQAGDRVVVQPLVFCGRCRMCAAGLTNLCSNMYLIGGEQPGGFAEFVAAPEGSVFRIPDELSFEHAALVETLATPIHAFEEHARGLVRSVAVLGAGTQGLLSLQLAHLIGATNIIVSDVIEHRLQIAAQLGATHIVNGRIGDVVQEVAKLTDGEGVDLVIEAAGIAATRQQAVAMLRTGGTSVFLALGTQLTSIDFMDVVPRELHLHGSQCYTNDNFTRAIELLTTRQINAEPLVQSAPLSEGAALFDALATNPEDRIKVVLQP
jgi:2-desacetyl-2-hydroxyethyl bacteriochlorophyllide A dehydrogenase